MVFYWVINFLQKTNENKSTWVRFHSSKVEFICLLFGGNVGLKKSFRLCLTFKLYDDEWKKERKVILPQCTNVRFASFLSGGFTTRTVHNKSTGKKTGKTHLCVVMCYQQLWWSGQKSWPNLLEFAMFRQKLKHLARNGLDSSNNELMGSNQPAMNLVFPIFFLEFF